MLASEALESREAEKAAADKKFRKRTVEPIFIDDDDEGAKFAVTQSKNAR